MKLQVFTAADICATFQGGALLTLGHKFEKNLKPALAFCSFSAILEANGCGSPEDKAAVAPQRGGSLNIFDDSFEPVGRTLCGVTLSTSSTPAGSFFVPDVEVGGKSLKDLRQRRLTCVHAPTTPSAKDTPPHVFPVRWRPG